MKVVDVKHKELKWYNRNYFYVTTICLLSAFCLCYFFLNAQIACLIENKYWNLILSTFKHNSLMHLISNMIFFFLISLFLERHFGSFIYFIIFVFAVPFSNMAMFAVTQSTDFNGVCAINFFMYAVAIISFLLRLKWYMDKSFIFLIFELGFALIYMSMCSDTAQNVSELFAITFLNNLINVEAHWSAMVMGALTILFGYMFLFARAKTIKVTKDKKSKKKDRPVVKILKSDKVTVLKDPKKRINQNKKA